MTRKADDRPIMITGGAGFIGSNLADRLAAQGNDILIYDCLARPGVEANLSWLQARHDSRIRFLRADIRDTASLQAAASGVRAVFHFAAQVAVTTSLSNPREDFDINLRGTFDLIDVLRRTNPVPLIMASTNKVYGDLGGLALDKQGSRYAPRAAAIRDTGISEECALDFHTPYGCSKGGADQYVLDAARSYRLPSAVMRMSCIYGPRQMGTEDQGWVAHFLIRALESKPISIFGDGCQVRDILHVSDAVKAYVAALEHIESIAGQAFNLGGGPANAVSLLELLAEIEAIVGQPVRIQHAPWRAGDQRYFVTDRRRVSETLHLPSPMPWRDGLRDLAQWLRHAQRGQKYMRGCVEALP